MWAEETDRRWVTLISSRELNIFGASEIASKTGRSVQNICHAMDELESKRIIESIGKRKHSWKKYRLTDYGKKLLNLLEKELQLDVAKKITEELEYKFVKDAYNLIVVNPVVVYPKSKIFEAIEKILKEPRTRTVYVIDRTKKLYGIISLQHLLDISMKYIDINSKEIYSFSNYNLNILKDDIMEVIEKPFHVKLDDKLSTALRIMRGHNTNELAVIDNKGRLIGELNGMEILTHINNAISRRVSDKTRT
jgi:CBS domain-containing protein